MLENLPPRKLESAFPWTGPCLRIPRGSLPRPLPGPHLMIGSDCNGDHRRSDYRVYGYLMAHADHSPTYPQARRAVRDRFLPDGRRMSYKRLADGIRQKALLPFLQAAGRFRGICCAFVVRKDLERMSTSHDSLRA